VCELDVSEPEVALNGLISVSPASSDKLPTEVANELASIEDAGTEYIFENLHSNFCMHYYANGIIS